MMPLKQGKILPPPPNVFLLDSARAPAAPCEPCMTGVNGGTTRTGAPSPVLEALPCGHPGPGTVDGFPVHEAGSGMLR